MDYMLSTTVLVFPSSSVSVTPCVTVNTTNDTILEEDEQFLIQFNSTDRAVEFADNGSLIVTIVDDDGRTESVLGFFLRIMKSNVLE